MEEFHFLLDNPDVRREQFCTQLEQFAQNDPDATKFTTDDYHFHLDDDDARALGHVAQNSTHLTDFYLDVTGMTRKGCTTLVPFLETSKSLETVRLEGDLSTAAKKRQTLSVTNALLDGLRKNPHVRDIQLIRTHFPPRQFEHLLRSSGGSGNPHPAPSSSSISSSTSPSSMSSQLRSLSFVKCWRTATQAMKKSAATAAKALNRNTTLQELALLGLQDDILATLLEHGVQDQASIRQLHLSNLSADSAMALRQVLDANGCTITLLVFYSAFWTATNLQPLLDGLLNSSVKRLFFRRCQFESLEVVQLLKTNLFRAKHVEELILNGSIPNAETLSEILTGLFRNTTVKELDISKNGFDGFPASAHIRDLLRRNRYLRRLDVDRNAFGSEGAGRIAEGLRTNRALEHLDISACDLGDSGALQIFQAVRTHPTLRTLMLCANNVGVAGLSTLEATVQGCPTLEMLALSGNKSLGDEAATNVLEGLLRTNTSLKYLFVDNCGFTGLGLVAILRALTENTTLQRLETDGLDLSNAADVDETCNGMAAALPHLSLKRWSFSFSGVPNGRHVAPDHLQARILKGFEQNTSLECFKSSDSPWFLNESKNAHIEYYLLRNKVQPFINSNNNNHGDENDDDDGMGGTEATPRSFFAPLFAKLNTRRSGLSVIFQALRSRPDLLGIAETVDNNDPTATSSTTAGSVAATMRESIRDSRNNSAASAPALAETAAVSTTTTTRQSNRRRNNSAASGRSNSRKGRRVA